MRTSYNIGVLIAVLLWSLSFIWTKGALDYLSPLMLVTFRVLTAMCCVGLFAYFTGRLQPLKGRDALIFCSLAIAEPVGYFLFETYGVLNVSPTLACVIVSTIPLFTPVMAYIVNGERVSKMVWSGLLVSILGVMMVVLSDGLDSISGRLTGVFLLFGAVITAMIYTVTVQRLSKRFNSFSIVAWQNVFSAAILIPLVLVFESDLLQNLQISVEWVGRVLTLGVLCSSVAFVLYANGIRELGVTRTSMFVNLMPSITAIASFLIMDESLGGIKIAGILVTIVGLYIGGRK